MEVVGIGGAVLVDDHEIDVEQLEAPILVSSQQLPNDVDVVELVDPNQHDRQVAGDAVRPEPGRSPLVAGEHVGRRSQRRVGVEDPVGETLEELRFGGVDTEVVELDLGVRPGEDPGTLEGARSPVLVGEVEHVLTRLGHDSGEDRVHRLARFDRRFGGAG